MRFTARKAFAAAGLVAFAALTFPYKDPDGAEAHLRDVEKLKDVSILEKRDGWLLSSCSRGDFFRTKFSATNAQSQPVSGTVCRSPWKGTFVRFDTVK